MTRLYNGVRLLGQGPSIKNVQKIDAGAIPIIIQMAKTGLQVDLSHFAKMDITLTQDMDRITEEVRSLTGHYLNLSSGDQIADLLFKKLKLKQARPKMTQNGDRESVEDEVLTAIQHDHPCVPKILSYKELEKLRGTYVRPMPRLARHTAFGTWRMFPNLATTRVPSGRLSCRGPNLLAMPNRTERGRDIRKGFITDAGWVYVTVDESQIEVRMAAHYSEDQNLCRVYENEEDIYSDFSITAFQLPDNRYKDNDGWHYPGVDKNEHRFPSKTCILASIYDVTEMGLLEQMPIVCANCHKEATKHDCKKFIALWTESKCLDLINSFYRRYPDIVHDRKVHHARARRYGYVWDIWGRILHVAAIRSVHPWVQRAALREAGNFPYQSGAQGTIKLTMAAVWDDINTPDMLEVIHPLLQIHDEILFECREDIADDLIELVKSRFEQCAPLRVPIKAGGAKAINWGSLEK